MNGTGPLGYAHSVRQSRGMNETGSLNAFPPRAPMTRSPADSGAQAAPEQNAAHAESDGSAATDAADPNDGPSGAAEREARSEAPREKTHAGPCVALSQRIDAANFDESALEDTCRLWLTRGDRIVVGTLAAGIFVLMLIHWVRLSGWGIQPVEIERMQPRSFDYKIDINEATWIEWAQLDGVGEVLADRIVGEREQNGPFRSIDDLERVKGIGPKTLEKIRPWLEAGTGESGIRIRE